MRSRPWSVRLNSVDSQPHQYILTVSLVKWPPHPPSDSFWVCFKWQFPFLLYIVTEMVWVILSFLDIFSWRNHITCLLDMHTFLGNLKGLCNLTLDCKISSDMRNPDTVGNKYGCFLTAVYCSVFLTVCTSPGTVDLPATSTFHVLSFDTLWGKTVSRTLLKSHRITRVSGFCFSTVWGSMPSQLTAQTTALLPLLFKKHTKMLTRICKVHAGNFPAVLSDPVYGVKCHFQKISSPWIGMDWTWPFRELLNY